MSALSNYTMNQQIDNLLRGRQFTAPTALYFALFSTALTKAGTGTELSGGGYARVLITPSDTAFTNTQGTTSGSSTGTSGTVSNGQVVQFATPSANWGTAVAVGVFSASSGGNMYQRGTLFPKNCPAGSDVKFPVGSLTFQIDSP